MTQLPLLISLCICTLLAWGWLLYRRLTGQRLLPLRPPEETATWGPGQVLLAIISVPLFQIVAYSCMQLVLDRPIADLGYTVGQAQVQVAFTSAGVVAAFFSLWFITRTTTRRWRDLGIGIAPLLPAVIMGLLCFLSFAAPSYLLNALLNEVDERIHPVILALRESKDMAYFTYSCVSVVLLSPLYEEIICRLILQGWLQSVFAGRPASRPVTSQSTGTQPGDLQSTDPDSAFRYQGLDRHAETEPADPRSAGNDEQAAAIPSRPTCWASIGLSSLFFAILHLEAGLASVGALFLFAVGLGLIYQRSGRLLPCVVMHMALNAFTMLALYLEIYA